MKIASYSVVHYGSAYLPYALHSISHIVDVSYVFYTAHPSHGHTTDKKCPESFDDIKDSIQYLQPPNYNIQLLEQSSFRYEGQQRDWAKQFVIEQEKPDFLIVLDYDEIWPDGGIDKAIQEILDSKKKVHTWLVNMTHFWKSFNWICPDPGWPERIFDLSVQPSDERSYLEQKGPHHFGYVISDELMSYKLSIHGHKNELRPNWYNDTWLNWKPGVEDVHPTNGDDFWNPEPYDKNQLPYYMRIHPYWNMNIIK